MLLFPINNIHKIQSFLYKLRSLFFHPPADPPGWSSGRLCRPAVHQLVVAAAAGGEAATGTAAGLQEGGHCKSVFEKTMLIAGANHE